METYVLVILPDYKVFGPYPTELEAEEAAFRYFGAGYDHASLNDDFFITALTDPSRV